MNTDVDVLIIGGGPAGLAAGIAFAGRGIRTLVCEKRALPANKPCGEGLMPIGLRHLERLGVKHHLRSGDYFPFDGIRYISSKGRIASAAFREGSGWGIPRLKLSEALLRRANELDCLEVRTGVQAHPVTIDQARGCIHAQLGAHQIQARLLIGADGLNSNVRRWAGLDQPKRSHERWGVRQHFRITPWSDKVEVYWKDGMEAYITPCGENLIGVALLWDRHRYRALPGGTNLVPTLLEKFPALTKRLKDTPSTDMALAIGPMQRVARGPVADAVVLAGDAAGYLDALTGEGLSLAFAQAIALEETVVPLLQARTEGLITRRNLSAYERAYRRIVQPYYRMTRLVLWLSRHPKLAEQAIGLLGRAPGVFQFLLSANMGLAGSYLTNKYLPRLDAG